MAPILEKRVCADCVALYIDGHACSCMCVRSELCRLDGPQNQRCRIKGPEEMGRGMGCHPYDDVRKVVR